MSTIYVDLLRARFNAGPWAMGAGRYVNLVQLAWQVRRERNRLSSLSRNDLADMGIHAGDAAREAQRGLFDLPKCRLEKL